MQSCNKGNINSKEVLDWLINRLKTSPSHRVFEKNWIDTVRIARHIGYTFNNKSQAEIDFIYDEILTNEDREILWKYLEFLRPLDSVKRKMLDFIEEKNLVDVYMSTITGRNDKQTHTKAYTLKDKYIKIEINFD